VFGGPLFEEEGLSSSSEGVVGASQVRGGWDICAHRAWGVEDQGEAGEPLREGEGEVCQRVDQEVFSDWWGGETRVSV